jgi:hypothetical protein
LRWFDFSAPIFLDLPKDNRVGRMKNNSITGKLLVHSACAALGAFVFGLCLVRAIKQLDRVYVTGMVLSGAFLIFALFWTHRAVRALAITETANKHATQFLWSCIFFSMLYLGFGLAVSNFAWFSPDFVSGFSVAFYGALTCVAIYPVHRDAKRLAEATGTNQIVTGSKN